MLLAGRLSLAAVQPVESVEVGLCVRLRQSVGLRLCVRLCVRLGLRLRLGLCERLGLGVLLVVVLLEGARLAKVQRQVQSGAVTRVARRRARTRARRVAGLSPVAQVDGRRAGRRASVTVAHPELLLLTRRRVVLPLQLAVALVVAHRVPMTLALVLALLAADWLLARVGVAVHGRGGGGGVAEGSVRQVVGVVLVVRVELVMLRVVRVEVWLRVGVRVGLLGGAVAVA